MITSDKRITRITNTLVGIYDADWATREGQHSPDLFLQLLTAIRQEYSCIGCDPSRIRKAISLLPEAFDAMEEKAGR